MDKVIEDIKALGTIEDEVERRDKLADITTELENLKNEHTTFSNENATLKAENERLLEYNRKLFMKVGIPDSERKEEEKIPEEKQPRKFEDLFNEKGELK